jgi:hypothetical protein
MPYVLNAGKDNIPLTEPSCSKNEQHILQGSLIIEL